MNFIYAGGLYRQIERKESSFSPLSDFLHKRKIVIKEVNSKALSKYRQDNMRLFAYNLYIIFQSVMNYDPLHTR